MLPINDALCGDASEAKLIVN